MNTIKTNDIDREKNVVFRNFVEKYEKSISLERRHLKGIFYFYKLCLYHKSKKDTQFNYLMEKCLADVMYDVRRCDAKIVYYNEFYSILYIKDVNYTIEEFHELYVSSEKIYTKEKFLSKYPVFKKEDNEEIDKLTDFANFCIFCEVHQKPKTWIFNNYHKISPVDSKKYIRGSTPSVGTKTRIFIQELETGKKIRPKNLKEKRADISKIEEIYSPSLFSKEYSNLICRGVKIETLCKLANFIILCIKSKCPLKYIQNNYMYYVKAKISLKVLRKIYVNELFKFNENKHSFHKTIKMLRINWEERKFVPHYITLSEIEQKYASELLLSQFSDFCEC